MPWETWVLISFILASAYGEEFLFWNLDFLINKFLPVSLQHLMKVLFRKDFVIEIISVNFLGVDN